MHRISVVIVLIGLLLSWSVQAAQPTKNANIDMAARINVAENICDINFGDKLLHYVMLGAAELRVDVNTAAKMADARHLEIVRYLNANRRLDQFCRNAKNGKL